MDSTDQTEFKWLGFAETLSMPIMLQLGPFHVEQVLHIRCPVLAERILQLFSYDRWNLSPATLEQPDDDLERP